jgi:hypothetical protein
MSSFSSFWQASVWAPNASLICKATSFTFHCQYTIYRV